MSELLRNIKYLVDNSACSLKLKQKIFLDMKEISLCLKNEETIREIVHSTDDVTAKVLQIIRVFEE